MKRFVPLLVVIALGALSGCASSRSALTPSPFGSLKVVTVILPNQGSMRPLLHGGERLTVVPVPFEKLRIGYAVVFYFRGQLMLHRIHSREMDRFITKGDNPLTNAYADPGYVTRDNYVGVVELDALSQIKFKDGVRP